MISYNTCIKQYRLPSETTILGMTSDNGATFNDANDLCFYPLEATFYCAKQCSHGDGKGLSKAGCVSAIKSGAPSAAEVCKHLKQNSPFQCTKTEVTYKSPLEKLSLSIANTQLLFGVLTAFFAFMFYKCKKSPKIASDVGKPWMDEIHRLREELRDLRQKVDRSDKQLV
jgi:hypothetical protein